MLLFTKVFMHFFMKGDEMLNFGTPLRVLIENRGVHYFLHSFSICLDLDSQKYNNERARVSLLQNQARF